MASRGAARRTSLTKLLSEAALDAPVTLTGWVKTARFSKNVSFVHVFDGSSTATIQVVLSAEQADAYSTHLGVGTAVRIVGVWKSSPGGKQAWEVAAEQIEVVGACDPADYPIQRKRTSLEHLRTIAHLRPRTNTFQSVFRVRNAAAWHIHRFFQERGFLWVHTPIITASDAEGAGEMFEVSAGAEPFFGKPAFLTVSGQLAVENFAQAFVDVYTFGPTFRAERSNTTRHASEFWMIEPEIAFGDLDDDIALAEDFVREVTTATLAQCADDFDFFNEHIEPGLLTELHATLARPFARITWHEARELLLKSGQKFDYDPRAASFSLQTEHERFLAEQYFKGPVFVTNYPPSKSRSTCGSTTPAPPMAARPSPPPTCWCRGSAS